MDRPSWRLFVAAPLPEETAAELWRQLAAFRQRHRQARWLTAEHYHATLVFLGQTAVADVERVVGALRDCALRWSAVPAAVRRVGGRVDGRRGGVAWLELGAGSDQLGAYSIELDGALRGGDGTSPPRPHVTLARQVNAGLLADLRKGTSWLELEWRFERVALFRSHTGPAGSRYEPLATFDLDRRRGS